MKTFSVEGIFFLPWVLFLLQGWDTKFDWSGKTVHALKSRSALALATVM